MTTPSPPDARPLMAKDKVLAVLASIWSVGLTGLNVTNFERARATIEALFDELAGKSERMVAVLDLLAREIALKDELCAELSTLRDENARLLARAELAERREKTERCLKLDMRKELDDEFTRAERAEAELSRRKDWISPETYALAVKDAEGGADWFWDAEFPDFGRDDIESVIAARVCNGLGDVGSRFEVQRAIRLPNITIELIETADGSIDYRTVNDTALTAPACSGVGGKDGGGTC